MLSCDGVGREKRLTAREGGLGLAWCRACLGVVPWRRLRWQVASIIKDTYRECDVVFIQEAKAGAFVQDKSGAGLAELYDVLQPSTLDAKRDQNCLGDS